MLQKNEEIKSIKLSQLFSFDYEVWVRIQDSILDISFDESTILSIIEEAECKGLLNKDSTIISTVQGDMAIILSVTALIRGYKLILVNADSMSRCSIENREIIESYCGEFVFTEREKGVKGAIEKAFSLCNEIPNSWFLEDFDNLLVAKVNYDILIKEIIDDFPQGVDYIITEWNEEHTQELAKTIKLKFPDTKVFAVKLNLSSSLSEFDLVSYQIKNLEKNDSSLIPDNCFFDGVIQIGRNEAYEYALSTMNKEKLFVGITTGASLAAIDKYIPVINPKTKVLVVKYKKRRKSFNRFWSSSYY